MEHVVIVSPGHYKRPGGSNTGAVGIGGFSEFELVGNVGKELLAVLTTAGIRAVLGVCEKVRNRMRFAAGVLKENPSKRIVFVEIHANAFKEPQARGTETFVWPRGSKSEELAGLIQSCLCRAFRKFDPSWKDRGVKYNWYAVLRKGFALDNGIKEKDYDTRFFPVLVELGFITNKKDLAVLGSPQGATASSGALSLGVNDWVLAA
ncbi:MAG: N-acetylmuramoyl-L-alanine amidase [bacterium]